jgi:tyrosinase
MKASRVTALALFAAVSYGSPLVPSDGQLVQRQTPGPGSYFAITGATGGVHPRLEIRELEKTGQMWNLFLLALKGFQDMDQSNIGSYYQVAGKLNTQRFYSQYLLHRRNPRDALVSLFLGRLSASYSNHVHRMPWDGVTGNTEGRSESERGYCPHFNLLFGTWHRPYLALFEVRNS